MTLDADATVAPDRPKGVVDAHMHLWDLGLRKHPWLRDAPPIRFRYGDYRAIRTTYLAADYRRDAAAVDVGATVYIEAEWDPADPVGEMEWIAAAAAGEGLPNAVVAQAWLDRDDAAEVLRRHAAFPLVRGVRHKPKAVATPDVARRGLSGSMDDPRWRDGYALLERHDLHFELQTPFWHLDAAYDLTRDFPSTRIVLNHAGLPVDRSSEGLAAWRRALAQVAQAPNVFLKISGLGSAGAPWSLDANRPVIRDAIAIFGVGRTMFGSNYPVDRLVGRFVDIFAGFAEATRDFAPVDRDAMFRDNALSFYRIA